MMMMLRMGIGMIMGNDDGEKNPCVNVKSGTESASKELLVV